MDNCFELVLNSNGQWDIIDHKESKEKGAVCIYNDLGVAPYSAAPSLCDLLNDLSNKLDDVIDTNNLGYEVAKHLKEENDRLKQELNYIQNSISEYIKHQKTELGQKALKQIIEDYNEWLLGYKELQE